MISRQGKPVARLVREGSTSQAVNQAHWMQRFRSGAGLCVYVGRLFPCTAWRQARGIHMRIDLKPLLLSGADVLDPLIANYL